MRELVSQSHRHQVSSSHESEFFLPRKQNALTARGSRRRLLGVEIEVVEVTSGKAACIAIFTGPISLECSSPVREFTPHVLHASVSTAKTSPNTCTEHHTLPSFHRLWPLLQPTMWYLITSGHTVYLLVSCLSLFFKGHASEVNGFSAW